jgi:hypothetical protein
LTLSTDRRPYGAPGNGEAIRTCRDPVREVFKGRVVRGARMATQLVSRLRSFDRLVSTQMDGRDIRINGAGRRCERIGNTSGVTLRPRRPKGTI